MFHRSTRLALALVLALALLSFGIPIASAAPPSNDNFAGAVAISPLPFTSTISTVEATTAPDDPFPFCGNGRSATVWYSFSSPSSVALDINTIGSSYTTSISLFTGQAGSLTQISCGVGQLRFATNPNTTYYLMVAATVTPYAPPSSGGDLILNAQQVPPPANDNFANATAITALPFSATADTSGATLEANENAIGCAGSSSTGSVWYRFTATKSIFHILQVSQFVPSSAAIYQGTSLGNLTVLRCESFTSQISFLATAGTTYYIQFSTLFGQQGQLPFTLDVAPPPFANIFLSPGDPSSFDTIQFFSDAFDPAGAFPLTISWNFGDGTTATGCCPVHRYAIDGDYLVKLTVTTTDGRTASPTRTVSVRTHDVALTKLAAPTSGQVGKTVRIIASVLNKRSPENVTVELQKSDPTVFGGFVTVGTLTQFSPGGNKTQSFTFNYTFTPSDAAIGKVTFRAIATINNARDALIADNTLIAPPTAVKR
jgi:PKD repeat protein